jgi:hypothetical protein
LCSGSSIGSWDGRKAMAWASVERARRKNPDYNVAKAIERINWRFERKTKWREPRNIVILSATVLVSIGLSVQQTLTIRGTLTIRDLIVSLLSGLLLGAIIVRITDAMARSRHR